MLFLTGGKEVRIERGSLAFILDLKAQIYLAINNTEVCEKLINMADLSQPKSIIQSNYSKSLKSY